MTKDQVFELQEVDSSIAAHLSPKGYSCDVMGIQAMALPPGEVNLTWHDAPLFLNILPHPTPCTINKYRLNGRDCKETLGRSGHMDLFAQGCEHQLWGENHGWELLLELNPGKLGQLAAEAWNGSAQINVDATSRSDPAATQLARLLVDHLRFAHIDPIYVEALATALTVKGVSSAIGKEKPVSTSGTDTRVARAIDYIEAHLDEALSLADIASAACMSPSWLKSCFRATTGQTVWGYVRERRLERARQMLFDRNLSLAQIAYDCGFSSHSHMTRLFRQHYGVSPKEMRS